MRSLRTSRSGPWIIRAGEVIVVYVYQLVNNDVKVEKIEWRVKNPRVVQQPEEGEEAKVDGQAAQQ